jgi:hypothetical protein
VRIHLLLGTLAILSAGCALHPINAPLARFDARPDGTGDGYRFSNFPPTDDPAAPLPPGNSDDLFVVVALSGGGARAAAFSYGLLEALRATPIHWHGRTKSLLDEVDVITSVSGSSFTAAYYALRGEKTFEEFLPRFLYRDIQGDVIGRTLNPLNWPRLASPAFDRVDLAAEYYDREIFHGATFADLLHAHRRPFLILNAADISLGTRFEFTQEQFDFLNSNLASVPLGRAVAASSAFPVVLNPIEFENYPKGPDFQEPTWIHDALAGAESHDVLALGGTGSQNTRAATQFAETTPHASPRLRRRAADLRSYENAALRPHIRLLDGAIADYMGLRGVMESILSDQQDWSLHRMLDQHRIKKLVIISLNAVRTPPVTWDHGWAAPGIFDVLYVTASAPIRNNAFDTITVLQDVLHDDQARRQAATGSPSAQIDFISLDFPQIEDPALRRRVEATATALSLPRRQVDDLRTAAAQLLRDSPEMQRLLRELNP